MTIQRTGEEGGTFSAPLAVDARITFVPVKPARSKAARALELTGRFTFPANPVAWSFHDGASDKRLSAVVVDTDGDLKPDTRLSTASNFLPGGWRQPQTKGIGESSCGCWDGDEVCHGWGSTHEHCTIPTAPPGCVLTECAY